MLNKVMQTVYVSAILFLTSKLPEDVTQAVQFCSVAFRQVNRNFH